MFDSPMPRSGKEKRIELPYRHLGPGNHIPKFQNDMVADLDFIKYRKSDADPPQDIIRLQNYSNYQSVCLAQNLDDIAQDVIKTQRHLNGLHSEIDSLEHGQKEMKLQLHTILEKLEVIEKAVANLKFSYQEESQPASPVLIPETSDATFSFFGPTTSSTDQKFITLKQLNSSLANPTLIRIAEVSQLAIEKLELVKSQISTLETQVNDSKTASLERQLSLVHISPPDSFVNSLSIKAMEGETKPTEEKPESSGTNF
jgi:hypothetical protein